MNAPIVLDLDDPFFHGLTLPSALDGYDHVHSTTGVCVKNAHGPMCPNPPVCTCPTDRPITSDEVCEACR